MISIFSVAALLYYLFFGVSGPHSLFGAWAISIFVAVQSFCFVFMGFSKRESLEEYMVLEKCSKWYYHLAQFCLFVFAILNSSGWEKKYFLAISVFSILSVLLIKRKNKKTLTKAMEFVTKKR